MDKTHPQDNQDELKNKIISSLTNRGNHIFSALVRNMTHVDTKLTEEGWRIQGFIQMRLFYEAINDSVTLTMGVDWVSKSVDIWVLLIDKMFIKETK